MTRVIEFLIALAIVAGLFLVVGLVLPSKRHLSESVETNRRMTIVYDTLNNVRRLPDWNPLVPADPAQVRFSGGGEGHVGQGARADFTTDDNFLGSGSWQIVESVAPAPGTPGRIVYEIGGSTAGKGRNKKVVFTLEPTGRNDRNVKITQTYDVEYGWNLIGRYSGMYVSRHVGDQVKSGLTRLTNMLATVPNFDYRVEGSKLTGLKVVDVPAENLLVVNAGNIDRRNEEIMTAIKNNQEWIKRVMDANSLEAAGPVRIITTDFGAEKYAFDVAVPVRKKGSGGPAKDDEEEKRENEEAAPEPAAPAPAVDEGPLEVKIPDGAPVEYVRTEPHKAAFAQYTGYMAELDAVRNSVRAWAMTNGYEVTDRPYEAWKGGVDKSFTADGTFDVYWAIK